jgi:hypothetical protein
MAFCIKCATVLALRGPAKLTACGMCGRSSLGSVVSAEPIVPKKASARLILAARQVWQRSANKKPLRKVKLPNDPWPMIFCRCIDPGTDNECWVICAESDPGAVAFVREP